MVIELRSGPSDQVEFANWMDRLGRYQILDPIGSGPCGAVVRAKVYGVVGVDRQFAIKQILPALTAHAPYAQALSAAARAYGSLEHPRIARLAEFTVSQGKTFTATELVTGLDVGRLVAESRVSGNALPPGGALALLSAAARAVGYAHGRGLVHLGLCPQNLLISADGDIKVTDFGILAACLPERPVQEPRLAHRVAYLAPEQLAGEPTSSATDVFALGAIAIEMVTGAPAFRGETPLDVQHAVLSGQLNDPSLPRPIVRVLQRCLARAPFERFPDARAFADALEAALRTAPVPGVRQDIAERVKAIMAHLAALNEGGLSGVVSLPSSMAAPVTRPPTSLSPEVIATPISLRDADRLETSELPRDDAYGAGGADGTQGGNEGDEADEEISVETQSEGSGDEGEELLDEELDEDDLVPHTVVQPMAASPSRSHRVTDAPMIAATLRGISAASAPRPMPPSSAVAPPPLPPKARARTAQLAEAEPPAASPPSPPMVPATPPPMGRRSDAAARPGSVEEVTREMRVSRPLNAVRPGDPAAPLAAESAAGGGERSEGGVQRSDETARHRAEAKNAWDEAMESFEQPTRLNESLTAQLLPSTSRTGPSPLIELDELVLASLSDPLPRPVPVPSDAGEAAASMAASSAPGEAPAEDAGAMLGARGSDAGYPMSEGLHGANGAGDEAPEEGEAPAIPIGPSTAQVRQAAIRPPGDGSSPWPNGVTGSSGLVMVIDGDQVEQARRSALGRASDAGPMEPPAGFGVPPMHPGERPMPVRPSERSMPRPGEWGPERASSPALPMPGAPQRGSSEGPFPRLTTGPFGRIEPGPTGLPPLPMGFPPEQVPKLTGSGMRWLWMLLGVAIVVGSALAAYVVFGGFPERGTLAQPGLDAGLASMMSHRDGGHGSAVGDADAAKSGDAAAAGDAAASADAGAADASSAGTPATGGDAGAADAKVAAAGDAAPADAGAAGDAAAAGATSPSPGSEVRPPPEGGDGLSIVSKPSGARVYIDGADQGQTPLRLPGPADRHSAVLFLAGHDLAKLEVDKNGTYSAELKEITPLGGPAGIKVRCKMKDRYYVYIDGKPTGALCPTERLEVERGDHVVEIYDLVSETSRQFRVNVKDTSRSTRVRVD